MASLVRSAFSCFSGTPYTATHVGLCGPSIHHDGLLGTVSQSQTSVVRVRVRVHVLGCYGRGNLGYECYMPALHALLPGSTYSLRFSHPDELDVLPPDTDIVLCAGGDIVNEYFVNRICMLVGATTVPCYAVSMGIPYGDDAHVKCLLSVFDHVIVSTTADYKLVERLVGEPNVTYMPDLVFSLRLPSKPLILPAPPQKSLWRRKPQVPSPPARPAWPGPGGMPSEPRVRNSTWTGNGAGHC